MPQASVSRIRCPFALGGASTCGCTSVVLSDSTANNSVSSGEKETLRVGLFVVAFSEGLQC